MPTTLSPLRRVPLPQSEPPYDDEVTHPQPATTSSSGWVQGSLALSIPRPTPVGPIPQPSRPRTPLRLVPDPRNDRKVRKVPCDDDDDDFTDPIPAIHHPWIARLAQALLEALSGDRPHGQLLPWTSDEVYAAVVKYATESARKRPNVDLTRHAPAHARSVRVTKPAPAVAEVCALVQRGARLQAVALRLEAWRGRWRCTAFEHV